MWWLTATLPAKDGALLQTALDSLAQPRPASDGEVDPRSRGQRMADALTGLAELSLAQRQGEPGGLPSRHGSPVRMIVTADLATLKADLTRKGGQAGAPMAVVETGEPGGWEVSPLQAQTLFCDAEVVPAVLDGDGRPLDVGDSVYRFPPRIRRAIEIRDRTAPSRTAPHPRRGATPITWSRSGEMASRAGRRRRPTARCCADGTIATCMPPAGPAGSSTVTSPGTRRGPEQHRPNPTTTSDRSKRGCASSPPAGSPATPTSEIPARPPGVTAHEAPARGLSNTARFTDCLVWQTQFSDPRVVQRRAAGVRWGHEHPGCR